MEANGPNNLNASARSVSSSLIDGAILGAVAGLTLIWLGAGVGGAIVAIAIFCLVVWLMPSDNDHLPGTAPMPLPDPSHERISEALRGWIRARHAQGSLDAPWRTLANEASRSLGRRVGVEELCAALEELDAAIALRRSEREASR